MFTERKYHSAQSKGWIEVICGSMFSGKTEELIRRLNRARIAQQKVEIFKPSVDTRYHHSDVVSHSSLSIVAKPVQASLNILLMHNEASVIGIDEAQFFDDEIVYVCQTLAEQGKRVIVAGLDMDSLGNPFGSLPALMATAEYVTKVHAICVVCGDLASYSFRKTNDHSSLIMLGEKDTYEARCRSCFNEGLQAAKSRD